MSTRGRTARNKAVSIVNKILPRSFVTKDQLQTAYTQVERRFKSADLHDFRLKPPTVGGMKTITAHEECARCGCKRSMEMKSTNMIGPAIDRHVRLALTYGDVVQEFPECI